MRRQIIYNKTILLFFLFFFSAACTFGQVSKKESLMAAVKTAAPDSNKVNALNALGREYIIEGEYIPADSILSISLQLAQQLKFSAGEAQALTNTGVLYWYQADYPEALEHYFKALRIVEASGNKNMTARSLANIGLVFSSQGDRQKALDYYERALKIKEEIGDKKAATIIRGNIAELYKTGGDPKLALESYLTALENSEEMKEQGLTGLYLASIASIYEARTEYAAALSYYLKALSIAETIKDKVLVAGVSNSIGGIYTKQKNYAEAERYLSSALKISSETGDLDTKKNAHRELSDLYEQQSKWQLAFENYKKFTAARDSIFNEEKTKKTVRSEMNFYFDKKQTAEKVAQAKKDAIAEEELKRQRMQRNYFIVGFLLMLTLALFIFRGYRQKQKANEIIAAQKMEVEEQKDLIEEKSKEITDSIMYAKRLQDAILPPQSYIDTFLPENFVLYKPKDIVAGDFYWMERKDDRTFIAVADCTGHGVPGAMVSVICSNALNRAVMEFGISDPGQILDKARELVMATFSKSDKDVKDGMDISLCSIRSSGEVEWAGAYNPLWYISSGVFKELTADKQPIGKTENAAAFTTHKILLNKGDLLYLFTDGYADQFGGEKGKKFKYKPFKELLNKNAGLPAIVQKAVLEEAFHNWKGNLEQVDDVCIIGIRI
ncbi:MAG: protein serine/threonine phosphatase [Bacteroidetes bacterium]|nr:protein serine/threonine phosphatase [Bacteroidota bacterium]